MSNFEDEIRKQRGNLDREEAPIDQMWANVESKVVAPKVRKGLPWKQIAVAASIVSVAFVAYQFGAYMGPVPEITEVDKSLEIRDIDPEMAMMEAVLKSEYETKLATLADYEYNPEQVAIFQQELDELDLLDQEMRQMLGKVQNQEKLLRTLLDHYRKRMKIIDRMIQKIEREKRKDNRRNETFI